MVPAGGNVQAAVNAAQCGDTIALQAGARFNIAGRLTFPNKGACTTYITVTTTDPSSIPSVLRTAYPNSYSNGTFTRMTPAIAAPMPKLVSTTNDPVIFLDRLAHHWKFVGLELTTADNGVQHTMLVGDGSTGVSDLPHHITFDQLYIHPVEEVGDLTTNIQYRSTEMAFILNGDFYTISNSAIQGFTGWTRFPQGAYRLNANSILFGIARNAVVENNLLEANGQIFLAGGGGVNPAHTAQATNVTFTSATLSNTTNLNVGDLIAIYSKGYSDNHIIQHPGDPRQLVPRVGAYINGKITSINYSTGAVTYTRLTGGLEYRRFNINLWGSSGGTFTLTWMGQTTGPIPYNATSAQIRAALEALPNVDPQDFFVRSNSQGWPYGDYMIRFGFNDNGDPSGQWQYPRAVNPMKINYSGLTGYQYQPWVAVHFSESYFPAENSADGTLIDVPQEGANVQWKGFTSDTNVFRRNIIAHHPEWTAVTGSVKGFAEIKGGTRTIFDGNIFSGEGTTIIWTVRNQGDGCSAPWSDDSYSQITNNIFDVTGYTNGFFLQDSACENIESHDILLSNNLFVNPDNTQNPWIRLVSGYNVTITHNTVFAPNRIF
ncbi:MAG TPA: hypothetical protein VFM05_13775, partial [Candidatus Saccharimonadales bacterium]|nr:hypothetical protein [Candidatus Saccharimonadales bacterium]